MKLIVLYGPPASGKYTIAKALSEHFDFKLFHNHLTVDLLKSVLPFGTKEFFKLSQKIRLEIFKEACKQNIKGVLFTFVYEKNTDDEFVKNMIGVVENQGGEVIFIKLNCDNSELKKRVLDKSREKFQKVKSEEGLMKMLESGDFNSEIPFVNSIVIDNTNLSAKETLDQIILKIVV